MDSRIPVPKEENKCMTLDSSSDGDDGILQKSAFNNVHRKAESATAAQSSNDDYKQTDAIPVKPMMRCPICNLKFPLTEIEERADICATNRATPFLCIPEESNFKFDHQ